MADSQIQDLIPQEIRAFAEQSLQQARKAYDDLMAATGRAVSAYEDRAVSAQAGAREWQRKVIGFSERNVAASLEFAEKLARAKSPSEVMALHAEYVQTQARALAEQASEVGRQAVAAATGKSQTPG